MQGYFWNGEWMIPLYLLVLGVLQLLCVIWLFDIAKGVYAFVVSRGRAGNPTKNFLAAALRSRFRGRMNEMCNLSIANATASRRPDWPAC